ncbi:uncharacterized protein F5891DRAFT_1196702 [Suillus fuscotomentosus]|uniref:Uncharacterized protein n=1 Tax=Suillus fuscotomentosus TaxID=1912939 RepID=A0AAD4HE28_9AGAM|nr:uncharacterized protein F5891DRAFT_1196702 [Suillus fuscotomentosus]KAG1893173.1 hypothetical protein F5891DRAFT_1196702 [Suillus fuscotomentosus]
MLSASQHRPPMDQQSMCKLASTQIDAFLTELERLDDKMILTEVHLLESHIYRGIGNLSKSKVGPSSAIPVFSLYAYVHEMQRLPSLSLDLQSGVLHAKDKDYTIAYSYFYETFENMSSQDDPAALNALKYMLLCKVMLNMPEDVTSLLYIKLAQNLLRIGEPYSMVKIDYVAKQAISDDLGHGVPRRAGSGMTRMPDRI